MGEFVVSPCACHNAWWSKLWQAARRKFRRLWLPSSGTPRADCWGGPGDSSGAEFFEFVKQTRRFSRSAEGLHFLRHPAHSARTYFEGHRCSLDTDSGGARVGDSPVPRRIEDNAVCLCNVGYSVDDSNSGVRTVHLTYDAEQRKPVEGADVPSLDLVVDVPAPQVVEEVQRGRGPVHRHRAGDDTENPYFRSCESPVSSFTVNYKKISSIRSQ